MSYRCQRVILLLAAAVAVAAVALVAAWTCGDPDDPPWVDFGSPVSGGVLNGDVPLDATPIDGSSTSTASPFGILNPQAAAKPDPSKIARVEFQARGEVIASITGRPPYRATWDTTKSHDGHCALKAVAYDATGKLLGRSRTVHVTIANALLIDEPAKREAVSGVVTISGSTRPGVTVTRTRLSVEGQVIGTCTGSSFSFEWDSTTVADGEHILRIKAHDGKRPVGSAAVRVVVNNS